jgi:hypothetical protein
MLNYVLICVLLLAGGAQSWASSSGKSRHHLELCAEYIMRVGPHKSLPSSEISGQVEGSFRLSRLLFLHSGVGFFLDFGSKTQYGPEINNSFELKVGHDKYIGFLASVM